MPQRGGTPQHWNPLPGPAMTCPPVWRGRSAETGRSAWRGRLAWHGRPAWQYQPLSRCRPQGWECPLAAGRPDRPVRRDGRSWRDGRPGGWARGPAPRDGHRGRCLPVTAPCPRTMSSAQPPADRRLLGDRPWPREPRAVRIPPNRLGRLARLRSRAWRAPPTRWKWRGAFPARRGSPYPGRLLRSRKVLDQRERSDPRAPSPWLRVARRVVGQPAEGPQKLVGPPRWVCRSEAERSWAPPGPSHRQASD